MICIRRFVISSRHNEAAVILTAVKEAEAAEEMEAVEAVETVEAVEVIEAMGPVKQVEAAAAEGVAMEGIACLSMWILVPCHGSRRGLEACLRLFLPTAPAMMPTPRGAVRATGKMRGGGTGREGNPPQETRETRETRETGETGETRETGEMGETEGAGLGVAAELAGLVRRLEGGGVGGSAHLRTPRRQLLVHRRECQYKYSSNSSS